LEDEKGTGIIALFYYVVSLLNLTREETFKQVLRDPGIFDDRREDKV